MRKFLLLLACLSCLFFESNAQNSARIELKSSETISKSDFLNSNQLSPAVLNALSRGGACETWTGPTPPSTYNAFASTGAPCDDGTGCTTNEFTSYQVYASEAYAMPRIIAGATYKFGTCTGSGAANWTPDFTIVAPSGAIDAYGLDSGSDCELTFTATENGTYTIIINESGYCGGGPNTDRDGGYPSITCIANAACVVDCIAGTIVGDSEQDVCPGENADLSVEGVSIPTGGNFGWSFRAGSNGTGGVATFQLSGASPTVSYDSGLNGVLAANSLEPLLGEWIIKAVTYLDEQNALTSTCDISADSFIVNFLEEGAIECEEVEPCDAPMFAGSSDVTSDGATIIWTPDENNSYDIAIIDVTGGQTFSGDPTETGVTPPYVLTGLAAENTYNIYLRADCPDEPLLRTVSEWSDPIEVTTMAAMVNDCEEPTNLAADNVTANSVDLSWAGNANNYDIELVDVENGDSPTQTPTEEGVDNPFTLTGLTPDNDYAAYVRANCEEAGVALIISGVMDGPLSGGTPKVIEFYAKADIADLSSYGFGSANNGGGTDGEEFTFSGSVSAGEFFHVTTDADRFAEFFSGDSARFVSGAAAINGDDAVELFKDGAVVDVFGVDSVDGSGTDWEYLDGWAYRVLGTGPDGTTFVLNNWTFSGVNVLDGESSNATAATPFPINSYTNPPGRMPSDWVGPVNFTTLPLASLPVADFSGSPTTVCLNDTVTFTDASTETPTAWAWNFGDGNTSTEQNPTHVYASAGEYTVQLIATNESGSDTIIRDDYISVQNPPTGFGATATELTIEEGESTTLQMTGTFGGAYAWLDASGNQFATGPSVSVQPTATTTYTATCSNGVCVVSAEVTITVNPVVQPGAVNDSCAGAITVTCDTDINVDGSLATIGEAPCDGNSMGLWYTFVGDGQRWDIQAQAQTTDIRIDLYTGDCANLVCEDDVDLEVGLPEELSVLTVENETYYLFIGGYNDGQVLDSFNLNITCIEILPPPANDTCGGATAITCPSFSETVSLADATAGDNPVCGFGSTGPGVWYTYQGDGSILTITGTPNNWNLELQIHSGQCGDLACVENADDEFGVGAESIEDFETEVGTTYYIFASTWASFDTNIDSLTLEVTCTAPPTCFPPTNLSAMVTSATEGTVTWSPGLDETTWHLEVINISNGETFTDTPNISGITDTFYVATGLTEGDEYAIQIISDCDTDSSEWSDDVSWSQLVPPSNDLCADAIALNCDDTGVEGNTLSASASDVPSGCGGSEGVWYSFEGNGDSVTITVAAGAGFDHEVGLHTGECGALTNLACADAALTGGTETLEFLAVDGNNYYIYIADWSSSTGNSNAGSFTIDVTCTPNILPECPQPTNVTATVTDVNQGTVTWAAGGDETTWHLEVINISNGESFTNTPNISGVTDTFYVANGLTEGDEYAIQIIADCGTDSSEWTTPVEWTQEVRNDCSDWINPTDSTGWIDFNDEFGGAPCDDGSGCPFNEITAFEVFASEAYSIDNFVAGGEYTFSMCNGPGAGSWIPEFTIIAPSGAVDAYGAGDGDSCSITWTASEDGTYLIVINEAGACGGGDNTQVANGFPAITCTSGGQAVCPPTPDNDECAEALPLSVAPDKASCSELAGTTINATQSEPAPSCSFTWYDDDVWYTFETGADLPETGIVISVDHEEHDGSGIAVYDSCGGNELGCISSSVDDSLLINSADLQPNTSYIVRVWSPTADASAQSDFTICAYEDNTVPTPAPANDLCAGATTITCPSFTDVIADGSGITADDFPTCGTSTMGAGVWYTFEGDGSSLTISVGGSTTWDAELQIFSGDCGNLTCLVNVDAGLGGDTETLEDFATEVGLTYYIYAGTWISTEVDIDSLIFEVTCTPPPSCAPISDLTVSNIGETTADISWTPGADEASWNVEVINVTENDTFTLTPTQTTTDTFVNLTGLVSGNDYEVSVQAVCDDINSEWSDSEEFTTLVPAPANDTCGGAIEVTCGSSGVYDATGATNIDGESCFFNGIGYGVWFKITGDGSIATITADPDGWDNELQVFSGACGALECEERSDVGFTGGAETVNLQLVDGQDYYIHVATYSTFSSTIGEFTLDIECVAPPENDLCEDAIEISCGETVYGDNTNATAAGFGNLPACGPNTTLGRGLWYEFEGTGDVANFSLCSDSTEFDTKLAVYTGDCDELVCLVNNDDECGTASEVEFTSEEGVDYLIYVSGYDGDEAGMFGLTLTCTEPSCDTAQIGAPIITTSTCGDNGSIDITVSGGSGNFSYLWSNGATTEDISGLAAGDYTVEVSDDLDGCPATATFTVPGNELFTEIEPAIVVGLPCDGSAGTGSIDVTIGGGTPPYTYAWSNGETTEDLTGLGEGSYTLTVTDDGGTCTYTTQTFVIQPAGISSIVEVSPAVVTDVECNGGSTGAIDISVSGGVAPYTYRWSNEMNTEDVEGLPAGEYIFYVTDATGCEYTSGVIVVGEPDAITESADAVVSDAACNGGADGSIDISIQGGTMPYTYVWTNGSTEEDPNDLSAGQHQATITDANGCTFLTPVFVIGEPAAISIVGTVTDATCNGEASGSIDITVTGGTAPYDFDWSDGSSDEDLADAPAGEYTVTVTDDNDCEVTSMTFTIAEPTAIMITAAEVTDAACNGGSTGAINISVAGGNAPYTYLWSNGVTSQDLSDVPAGDYTGVITDANGCSITSPVVTVGEPDAISVSALETTDVTCNGESTGAIDVTIIGGTAPYTFSWSNGATSEDLMDLPAGDYVGTVTDANGCEFVSPTITITEPTALALSGAQITNVTCNGEATGAIDIEVEGGTAPYTYSWSNGETDQDLTDLAAGDYTGTVTDANGCSISATVTVEEPAAIFEALPPAVTNVSCNGEVDGAIDITLQGGTLPYSIIWSNGETTEDIDDLAPGDYSYTVVDNNGCTFNSATITITQPDSLKLASAEVTNIACLGDASGAIDIEVEGGTMPYTYSWSDGSITQDLDDLAAGDYTGTITDANGCSISATVTITEPTSELTAEVNVEDETSNGAGDGSATVTASGGDGTYSYEWNDGFGNGTTISDLQSGIYCVDVTDGNGCTVTVCGSVGNPTAIDDLLDVSQIQLYPNPTYNYANLRLSFNKAVDVELAVVDVLGKVHSSEMIYDTQELNKVFDMTNLASGTYFIRIAADSEVISLPLIVQ